MNTLPKTFVLSLDSRRKNAMFQEYMPNSQARHLICESDPLEALEKVQKFNPEIIIFGGDTDDDFKAVTLAMKLSEKNLLKGKKLLISSWSSKEAQILRRLFPDAFYCPFSMSFANMVSKEITQLRKNQKGKICRKIAKNKQIASKNQ